MTDPNQPQTRQRLRLSFAKKKEIKYIGHLDLALAWERALRRAQLPLAYSQGYNPRPKMQFASGLPLGSTGTAEILDIVLTEPVLTSEASYCISQKLPRGIGLNSVKEIPLKAPTLQNLLRQAEYSVMVEIGELPADLLRKRIEAVLAAEEIIQTRRRKGRDEKFDLRPWLYELQLRSVEKGDAHLFLRVAAGQHGNLRPEDVLRTLDLVENWAEIERTRLIFVESPETDE